MSSSGFDRMFDPFDRELFGYCRRRPSRKGSRYGDSIRDLEKRDVVLVVLIGDSSEVGG
jgi:hypothetical protein